MKLSPLAQALRALLRAHPAAVPEPVPAGK
jgi:hypothetical protein